MKNPNSSDADAMIFALQYLPGVAGSQFAKHVCKVVDPILDVWTEEQHNKAESELDHKVTAMISNGVHLAFWIMEDELYKLPSDVIQRDGLIYLCLLDSFNGDILETEPFKSNFEFYMKDEVKSQWILKLSSLVVEAAVLICSAILTLIRFWEHIRLQDEFRAQLEKEKSSY